MFPTTDTVGTVPVSAGPRAALEHAQLLISQVEEFINVKKSVFFLKHYEENQ